MAQSTDSHQRILILDELGEEVESPGGWLQSHFPHADVAVVHETGQVAAAVSEKDFDIVVLHCGSVSAPAVELIHRLRLRDVEPAVLVVSPNPDPRFVAEVYNSGCQRCIVKNANWREELAPAIRHLLRMRKLESENNKLLAKLTEANILLEEKNSRLNEFSSTLAHDIRSPLGGISMKLEYILDQCPDQIDQRFEQMLRRALSSTDRLTKIVQVMYEYARVGSQTTQMSNVNLGTLVEEILSDMNFDPALDIRIGLGELPTVWGNDALLRRVFMNLISNAVKYNDKKTIVINLALQGIIKKGIADFAEITIEDNGPGIPDLNQRDIFSMFVRGAHSDKNPDGLGMGLAIVQRIIEAHFGKIAVSSTAGQGTRFTVTLPMQAIDFIQ